MVQGLSHYLFSSYYLVHFALVLGYVFIRKTKECRALEAKDDWLGLPRELEIIGTLWLFLFQKYRKENTFQGFMAQVFLYTKTGLVVLLYFIDWRIMVWYLIMYAVIFAVVKPPKYKGPNECAVLTGPEFESQVMHAGKGARTWLVMLTASWSPTCDYSFPLFAELSTQYSTPSFKFGRIDVSRWPEVATQLKIDLSATSKQLPSFVLIEKSKEAKRLPPFNSKGEVVPVSFDKDGLISYFDLDRYMVDGPSSKKNE